MCSGVQAPRSPLDDTPLAEHLDRPLTWDCGGARDTLKLDRDGGFTWVVAPEPGAWSRVDGRWTLEGTSGVGATLTIEGIRSTKEAGADRPAEAPFVGTIHVAPVRELPKPGVVRELDRWREACVRELDPAALVDAAIGVDALALRGDLEGLFHP
jgi:hypothetical protein